MHRAPHTIAVLAIMVQTTACQEARGMVDAATNGSIRPARPPGCVVIAAGAPVQAALDDRGVAAVCLAPGAHTGPLRLTRPVTLWGPQDAVIRSRTGTTIELASSGAAVLGMTIDGTGGKFDRLDAAINVTASDTRVEGVTVINAVFGILVNQSARVQIVGNFIKGSRDPSVGLRGDSIRIWETTNSLITGNKIEDGRDIVIWYSRGNRITDNRVLRGRYGLHFMYSHDNEVIGNQFLEGVVGIFVMYSRGLHLADNLIADAGGAAGMAIGIKDSGNIYVTGNRLIHDTIGLYVDASPMQLGDKLEIDRNVFRFDDTAIVFHASGHHVQIRNNDFADNQTQLRVDGGGTATDVVWHGNYFDDYAGYDLDDDEAGDVPYEMRSLSNQLTSSSPGLALFRGTPALALVDAAAHLDPLYQPLALLADPAPRMTPRWDDRALRTPP